MWNCNLRSQDQNLTLDVVCKDDMTLQNLEVPASILCQFQYAIKRVLEERQRKRMMINQERYCDIDIISLHPLQGDIIGFRAMPRISLQGRLLKLHKDHLQRQLPHGRAGCICACTSQNPLDCSMPLPGSKTPKQPPQRDRNKRGYV